MAVSGSTKHDSGQRRIRPPGPRPVTVWLLGDQLTPRAASLEGLGPRDCRVLMVESLADAARLPSHKQKIVLEWSAMRHFADELRGLGYEVDHRPGERDLASGLRGHLGEYRPAEVRIMASADHGVAEELAETARAAGASVRILPNNMFICGKDDFARWAEGRKLLRMEDFYHGTRRRTGLLMDGGAPECGTWNLDRMNRAVPPRGERFPPIPSFEADETTREVMRDVERRFGGHFGRLDGFAWPVTRADAERFLDDFMERRLDLFGPYEDAIVAGERALYHSLISPALNLGLLDPLDVARRAEGRYREGAARLNSVEGFVRQVIGWREFVRGVYATRMPGYIRSNRLGADLPLPVFYWDAGTDMRCVADAIGSLIEHGINHHIQRLMVTGNLALTAGVRPREVNDWYLLAYADAHEWVVTPNVIGMALHADGGIVAAKPYAASAAYIDRMSDLCGGCRYSPRETIGERACPYNALYWDFLARHRERFERIPRMNLVMASLRKRSAVDLADTRRRARSLRSTLRRGGRL